MFTKTDLTNTAIAGFQVAPGIAAVKALLGLSVLVFFLICGGIYLMRTDLPYKFEIVPMSHKILVFNVTDWADKGCIIHLNDLVTKKTKKYILSGNKKSIQIPDVQNERNYRLKIIRNDWLGRLKYRPVTIDVIPLEETQKYFVLVGASVGAQWNLSEWASRVNQKTVYYGYRGTYDFDKTQLIDTLINSQQKPDGIIIKECAAYFPRDVSTSVATIQEWIKGVELSGATPILATVVPVTPENEAENPGRMDSINEYNRLIRGIAGQNNLPLLDLQLALSEKENIDGFLNKKYAVDDGLHLNKKAYEVLDQLLVQLAK